MCPRRSEKSEGQQDWVSNVTFCPSQSNLRGSNEKEGRHYTEESNQATLRNQGRKPPAAATSYSFGRFSSHDSQVQLPQAEYSDVRGKASFGSFRLREGIVGSAIFKNPPQNSQQNSAENLHSRTHQKISASRHSNRNSPNKNVVQITSM